MTTHKYGLIASLKAKEGKAKELGQILLKASELVSTSKGCISYVVSLDAEDGNLLWITEVWDSKSDHDESLKKPEVRALIGTAMPLLDGPPQKGKELKILGGLGSD
ncbi:MAG: antibiotic biosynthesis monooxygenase [Roseivirga sp.]|nr:antibiotic biosynthesis monooxygenase [Roseivirga sp.]